MQRTDAHTVDLTEAEIALVEAHSALLDEGYDTRTAVDIVKAVAGNTMMQEFEEYLRR